MNSNFEVLEGECPDLAKLGDLAECLVFIEQGLHYSMDTLKVDNTLILM